MMILQVFQSLTCAGLAIFTIAGMVTPAVLYVAAVLMAFKAIFVMGDPQLGQFESGLVGQLWNVPMSAFTGGLGALLLVLGLATMSDIRNFSLLESITGSSATASLRGDGKAKAGTYEVRVKGDTG